MVHRWDCLTFLHWPYDAATVQALLPDGLEPETYDGKAWVGLVPFRMTVRLPGLPAIPWASRFPETNVRTYVRGPDGTTGVWFFSLDAARLGAVAVARTTLNLPYVWSRMRVTETGGTVRYASRRRWPDRGRTTRIEVEPGERIDHASDFECYLTARFHLWTVLDGTPRKAPAHHDRWPLRRARVVTLDDHLVEACCLPKPTTEPIAHFSDGVRVVIGLPQRR